MHNQKIKKLDQGITQSGLNHLALRFPRKFPFLKRIFPHTESNFSPTFFFLFLSFSLSVFLVIVLSPHISFCFFVLPNSMFLPLLPLVVLVESFIIFPCLSHSLHTSTPFSFFSALNWRDLRISDNFTEYHSSSDTFSFLAGAEKWRRNYMKN